MEAALAFMLDYRLSPGCKFEFNVIKILKVNVFLIVYSLYLSLFVLHQPLKATSGSSVANSTRHVHVLLE